MMGVVFFESFRCGLWKNLVDYGYDFDFVGRQKDDGTYAEYLVREFDNDHKGQGGFESDDDLASRCISKKHLDVFCSRVLTISLIC